MNKKHKLAAFLHLITSILFWGLIVFLTFNITMSLFFKDSGIKTGKKSKIVNVNGYLIPVDINLSLRNHGYKYSKNGSSVNVYDDESLNEDLTYSGLYTKEQVDSIIQYPTEKNRIGSSLKLIDPQEESNFNFTNRIIGSQANIMVKPQKTFLSIILFFNQYYKILITILILFFLKRVFAYLKKDLKFSTLVAKNVKIIGLLLILKQVLSLILTATIGSYFSHILIDTPINFENAFNLSFHPTLRFNFSMFITGLSLLVVSTLLNKGNDLQTESNLTI